MLIPTMKSPLRAKILFDESIASKESDDASESGKKVTWVVDKPTTRSGTQQQNCVDIVVEMVTFPAISTEWYS